MFIFLYNSVFYNRFKFNHMPPFGTNTTFFSQYSIRFVVFAHGDTWKFISNDITPKRISIIAKRDPIQFLGP